MLAKIAVLFLVGMVIMSLFLARPKRRGGDGGSRGARGRRGRVTEARLCPDCGAYVAKGATCPCRDG